MKHHTLLVHSQTRRLNDIWDLGLREAVDGTSLQWREQPSVAGHFAFPIMNSDCCPLWSIDERLKETNKNKEKEKKKKGKKRKNSNHSCLFLPFPFSIPLPSPPFSSSFSFSPTTLLKALGLGPLFGRFFLLSGGRLLEAPGLLQLQ